MFKSIENMDSYKRVQTYDELLQTNQDFFSGTLDRTLYYCARWGEGEDQNNHAEVATENLKALTLTHRVFTVNGQSSYHDEATDQRSYLSGFMEKETFERVRESLLGDPNIWTIFFVEDPKRLCWSCIREISSLPSTVSQIVLTLDTKTPYSIFYRDPEARMEYMDTGYPAIDRIMSTLVFFMIICKEWNAEPNADTILLKHLSHLSR